MPIAETPKERRKPDSEDEDEDEDEDGDSDDTLGKRMVFPPVPLDPI